MGGWDVFEGSVCQCPAAAMFVRCLQHHVDRETATAAPRPMLDLPPPARAVLRVPCSFACALHQAAPCCSGPHATTAAAAPSSSCATDNSSGPSSLAPGLPSNPLQAPSPAAVDPVSLLSGAACEVQMMLLLEQAAAHSSSAAGTAGSSSRSQADAALQEFREKHLLDAVVSSNRRRCCVVRGCHLEHMCTADELLGVCCCRVPTMLCVRAAACRSS